MTKGRKKTGTPGVEILIVEDSPTQAEQLKFLLEERGYAVRVAANGRNALELLRRRKPTLVITDIVMPEMDGFALCKTIKSDRMLNDIPVVIVTSLSGIHDIAKSLECGADNFIRKPYDPKMLLARIEYILLNVELRKSRKLRVGMEVVLHGEKHFITSEREQIIDLLISTYEEAVNINAELQERQKEIAKSNQTLGGLYRIAEELNRVSTETEVCERALKGAVQLPGVKAGWIYLVNDRRGFRTAATHNLPADLDAGGLLEQDCECRRKLIAGEIHASTRVVECQKLRGIAGRNSKKCLHAATPLVAGARCLGVMNLVGIEEVLAEHGLKTLDAIGNQTAVALERARLYHHLEALVQQRTAALQAEIEERKRAEEKVASLNRIYAVLSGINSTIVRVRERDELCKEACRIAVEHGKFRGAWIGLLAPENGKVRPVACRSTDEILARSVEGTEWDIEDDGQGLITQSIRDRKSVVCNELKAAANEPFVGKALEQDCHSLVVLPLMLETRVAGVFVLYGAEPDVFDAREMKLLEELAGDISFALEYIEKEERLNYLAYYDALTALPNRSLFYDRLNQLIQSARREGRVVAVAAINLERFTNINDTFGRNVGDDVLKLVAERLREATGSTDRLARIAADHFGVILADCAEESEVVRMLEERILQPMQRPFAIDGNELRVAAKIGIALFPSDGGDADTIFNNAETAFRKTKVSGERYLFYAPEMNARVAEKLTLENKLHRALENEEFVLHYQPKLDLESGKITGLEALIRWNDPETGLIPPGDFIPVLEETGMIAEVGKWSLERAAADYERWRADGLSPAPIAVNVSAVQLRQRDFLSIIEKLLSERRDGADWLELELTESLFMEDIAANIQRFQDIRAMRVKIAVDDFGTGYSSLSYIARLPIDSLKIDRVFIDRMLTNSVDAAIVSSIISLAHSLKLKVVAEGVETDDQLKFLRLLRCDEIQGYVYSPPLPTERIAALLGKLSMTG